MHVATTSDKQVNTISENHNSLGCEQPPGLDVNQSLNVQDEFWPIPGLISGTGVTGSVALLTCHVYTYNTDGMYIYTWYQEYALLAGSASRTMSLAAGRRE